MIICGRCLFSRLYTLPQGQCSASSCECEECYLVVLQSSGIEGPAQEQLSYHTAKWPHVDGLTKWQAQNNLWSPAETRGGRKGYMWEQTAMNKRHRQGLVSILLNNSKRYLDILGVSLYDRGRKTKCDEWYVGSNCRLPTAATAQHHSRRLWTGI